MRIAVVGAGAMGRWAVKELGLSPEVEEVVVGDFDEGQAAAVAASHGGGKCRPVRVDARERASVRRPSPAATLWSTPRSTSGTSR